MRSLGLDVGSTNIKAVLVEIDEPEGSDGSATGSGASGVRELAHAALPTPDDAAALVAAALRLVAAVLAGTDAHCVGIASMAETGVPLDADDDPVGDLVRWNHHRGRAEAERLAAEHGAADLFARTGVRPSGKVPLATWRHLRAHEPARWARMHRWAGAADLLGLALTGSLVTDHTLAGRTMAYPLPEPGAAPAPAFDAELLALAGLRPEQLPAVAAADGPAGSVRHGGVAGLRAGTPVVIAGHDHQVGAWAGGVRAPGDVADSLGTAEAVIRVIDDRPATDDVAAAGMSLVRTVAGEHDALVAGSASAGAMIAWWAERHARGRPVEAILEEAAGRARDVDAPLLLPYLDGRQSPAPDPAARARVVGAHDGADVVTLAGALLDGLSLHARWLLWEQSRLARAGLAGDVVVLGGAATNGSPWLRTKAAAGPARLRAVAAPEPVAAGAALLAAYRAGLAGAAVLPSRDVPTGPVRVYDELYARFIRAALEGDP